MEQLDFPAIDSSIRIPDKTHFKIGEVAKLLDLEPYVLRYWEKEFDILEPDKTDSGQRAYQRDDIELLATIQQLLYTEMFTIDGARRQLELAQEGEPSYLTSTLRESDEEGEAAEALEEARRQNEALRAENEKLADRSAELADENEQLADRNAELADENEQLVAQNSQLADENETLRNQLTDARQTIEKLEAEKQRLEQASAGLDADSRELIDALAGEVDALTELAR
ncbi:MAG: MerR family transcriptional regulator [Bradymonadaceae bacterium]